MLRYFQRFAASKHFVELRLIRKNHALRHWVKAADIKQAQLDQLGVMNRGGWEIFAGANPRPHSCSDVAEIVTLHADVDGTPKHSDVPTPSLIVNSGHGYHLYWELEAPVAPTPRIADINRGLAKAVGADPHCCDVTRILRVPGFLNNKEKPEREVSVELESETRYRVEEFEHLAVKATEGSALNPHKGKSGLLLADIMKKDSCLARAMRGGYADGASDSRVVAILRLNAHGFNVDEIEEIVAGNRWFNVKSKRVTPPEKARADVRRVLAKY